MKADASATVRATGNVLEAAKFGFGLGYLSSTVIIAIGQIILGNPLAAAYTAATAACAINPIAMTCGAIGAIYYGWKALSEDERNNIVNRLTAAFDVGAELIKAIVSFVLRTLGDLVSAENMQEYKKMVADAAITFGKSLSDVTRTVIDRLADAADAVTTAVGKTTDLALDGVSATAETVKKNVAMAASSVLESASNASDYLRGAGRSDPDK